MQWLHCSGPRHAQIAEKSAARIPVSNPTGLKVSAGNARNRIHRRALNLPGSKSGISHRFLAGLSKTCLTTAASATDGLASILSRMASTDALGARARLLYRSFIFSSVDRTQPESAEMPRSQLVRLRHRWHEICLDGELEIDVGMRRGCRVHLRFHQDPRQIEP